MNTLKKENDNKSSQPLEAVILIADLVASSDFANILDASDYVNFLQAFKETCENVIDDTLTSINKYRAHSNKRDLTKDDYYYKVSGDEFCVVIYVDKNKNNVGHIELSYAIRIARALKINWYLSEFNKERVKDFKHPSDIAIGINIGNVYLNNGDKNNPEGFAFNMAKRVEGEARKGLFTRIMLSQSAYQLAAKNDIKVFWAEPRLVEVKGIVQQTYIVEIKCFMGYIYWDRIEKLWKQLKRTDTEISSDDLTVSEKIFEQDYFNTWLCAEIATVYYYTFQFDKAIKILRDALTVRRDLPIIWLMLGSGIFNQAYKLSKKLCDKNKNILTKETEEIPYSMYQDSIKYIEYAINLDSNNEDSYIELGLVHYHIAVMKQKLYKKHNIEVKNGNNEHLKNDNELTEKSMYDELKKAFECFEEGMRVGISKGRALYFRWIAGVHWYMDKWKKYYDSKGAEPRPKANESPTLSELFLRIGWNDNTFDNISLLAQKYQDIVYFENFMPNIYWCEAIVFNEAWRQEQCLMKNPDEWINKSVILLETANKLSKYINDKEGVFCVTREPFVCIESKKVFCDMISDQLKKIESDKTIRIIPFEECNNEIPSKSF